MKSLAGLFTALVTPFKHGEIDWPSFERLLTIQFKSSIDGFVVNGTTAESPNLDRSEVELLIKKTRQIIGHDKTLMVGTGSNSTAKTIEMTKWAQAHGADAALVVVPYYNKPTQEGIFQHFKSVAENCQLPIMLYNIPGRTVVGMEVETIRRLSEIKNIVAIKEATGDMVFARQILQSVDPEFIVSSGDDGTALELINLGGKGCVSVLSHVAPDEFAGMLDLAKTQYEKAKENWVKLDKLTSLLFCEPNPTPVKKALQLLGVIDSADVRLPLLEMTEKNTALLKQELEKVNLSEWREWK